MLRSIPAAILVLAAAASPAFGHAVLIDSTPAPNGHVKPGALAIRFRYNSRIDTGRSKLTITGPDGIAHRIAIAPGDTAAILTASAPVTPGDWTLRWQVLATDGHLTRGTVPFTVDKN